MNNLRYADDSTLMSENEEELKSLLMKLKNSEKAGLKLNIQKTKIMASSPITSCQIEWKNWKQCLFFFFDSKSLWMVTATMKLIDPCSLEGKL